VSRSIFAIGIDPGATLGVAAVGLTSTLRVLETQSLSSVRELPAWLAAYGAPDVVAVEWWAFQGVRRARGTSEAAEAAGRVSGALEILNVAFDRYTRAEVLQSLSLRPNANKSTVMQRIAALAELQGNATIRNDHEADAVAAAITGLNRYRMRELFE
jgi:Holliday junction resolvasome RuvABC endonuclease subunit